MAQITYHIASFHVMSEFVTSLRPRAKRPPAAAVGQMAQIISLLRSDPVVVDVLDAKSEEIGPGVFRLKMEIEFSGKPNPKTLKPDTFKTLNLETLKTLKPLTVNSSVVAPLAPPQPPLPFG